RTTANFRIDAVRFRLGNNGNQPLVRAPSSSLPPFGQTPFEAHRGRYARQAVQFPDAHKRDTPARPREIPRKRPLPTSVVSAIRLVWLFASGDNASCSATGLASPRPAAAQYQLFPSGSPEFPPRCHAVGSRSRLAAHSETTC